MRHRWLVAGISAVLMLASMSGCGQKHVQLQEIPVLNYTAPAQGDEIIVMHIRDYGDVKIRLFPELLPEACENFRTLAERGYYDELIFHRVIRGFMVQSGDPRGDGFGGESCWGGQFDGGYDPQLIHVPGALAYANSNGTATDGSQFYIVTGSVVTEKTLSSYSEEQGIYYSTAAREAYLEHGGDPMLDGGSYTVFGQVIDGLDIVHQISLAATDPETDRPRKNIYIEKVSVEQYDGSEIRWYPADYTLS